MLGGYGITAELATAAFEACRSAELISERELSVSRWETELAKPLQLNGRSTRYRYPKQKARFLSNAMAFLRRSTIDEHCGRSLRDALLEINGVGPKTAGWVARNYLDTDDVAILDIHLVRAGVLCDLFAPAQRVERDYFEMERRYIEFCRALSARPAVLDCLIWDQMRSYGRVALGALSSKLGLAERPVSCRRRKSQLELSLAS
jgi:thermostable 8-oxoguanine DNA glycosylase